MNPSSISQEFLTEQLTEKFGWSDFKHGQIQVMQRLVDGRSTLAVFPTGGGKSLCYQLPALMFQGLTVVVSPLIALMKDQIDQLQSRGHQAVRLDSSLSTEEYRDAANLIRSGVAKLLYVAPERFFNERFRSSLHGIPVSMFAVDEAHCISQWGHNFRPDYLKLARVARELKAERVLALTATATVAVQEDICEAFEIEADDVICTPFFRQNLQLSTELVEERDQGQLLIEKIQARPVGATIVYVSLQKTAEQLAGRLQEAGLSAEAYHAGMDAESRNRVQEWFMHGTDRIVVATIAFGMGIDKSDIRYVYHFNPAKSIENYAQEIGRAGRDGADSICELLLVPADRIVLENFVYGDTPTQKSIGDFFQSMDPLEGEFFVSQYKLANACDIKPLVLKTLLTYLELDGYIEATSPRYDSFSFKPLVPSQKIIEQFDEERQAFIKGLLACSQKRKVWFVIDVSEAAKKLNCDRSRVVRALDYFAENGWMELKVSGLVHGYRRLKPFADLQALTNEYVNRIEQREQSEIERLDRYFELASANKCMAETLSAHFGQPLEQDCGVCSFCQGKGNPKIPIANDQAVSNDILNRLALLQTSQPNVFHSQRIAARFLCGMVSPSLTKARLTKHELFGICQGVSFAKVMEQVSELA